MGLRNAERLSRSQKSALSCKETWQCVDPIILQIDCGLSQRYFANLLLIFFTPTQNSGPHRTGRHVLLAEKCKRRRTFFWKMTSFTRTSLFWLCSLFFSTLS